MRALMRGNKGRLFESSFQFPPPLARDNNYSIKEAEAIIPPLKSRNILPTDTGSLFNDFEAQPLMVKQHDATIGKYIKFPLFLSQCLTGNSPRSLLAESTPSTIHYIFLPLFHCQVWSEGLWQACPALTFRRREAWRSRR